jgi:hypothetical protein
MKKWMLGAALTIVAQPVLAGMTDSAIPTRIDIVHGLGFTVHGDFGNPSGCTISDRIFVKIDNPQYDQIYAAALTALSAKLHVEAYINTVDCEYISWYGATYNVVENAAFYILGE